MNTEGLTSHGEHKSSVNSGYCRDSRSCQDYQRVSGLSRGAGSNGQEATEEQDGLAFLDVAGVGGWPRCGGKERVGGNSRKAAHGLRS